MNRSINGHMTLQHIATLCNTLQHTATMRVPEVRAAELWLNRSINGHMQYLFLTLNVRLCCSVLQCVTACCSVLQCVAVCCSVSAGKRELDQNTATHCNTLLNTLQHTATHCNTLPHTTIHGNLLHAMQRTSAHNQAHSARYRERKRERHSLFLFFSQRKKEKEGQIVCV